VEKYELPAIHPEKLLKLPQNRSKSLRKSTLRGNTVPGRIATIAHPAYIVPALRYFSTSMYHLLTTGKDGKSL
jgi:hypothetical protein